MKAVLTACAVAMVVAAGVWAPQVGAADTRLIDAVKAGDEPAVRALLARKAVDVNEPAADGTTALHWAARADHRPTMRMLLTAGANPNAATALGVSPLLLAVTNGSSHATGLLLEGGASVRAALPGGQTLLMHAARAGHAEVVRLLLGQGATVDAAEDALGETALMWAAAEDHADVVQTLAAAGAAVGARSREMAFSRQRFGDGRSARFTVLPRGGWTALMYAARQNAPAAVSALAAAGADLNATDPDGTTALTLAVINAHYDLAALLLDLGANPNVADTTGMTPLYAAVDMHTVDETPGRPAPVASGVLAVPDLIARLLARGADPNARLKTPLLERVHNNPDATLGEGATPLMRAARKGDLPLMRAVLDGGADPGARSARGATPLLYLAGFGGLGRFGEYDLSRATDVEFAEGMRLILDRGARLSDADDTGQAALHIAAAQRDEAVVRLLLDRGARRDALDKQGRTPLDVAMGQGARVRGGAAPPIRTQIVALLQRAQAAGPGEGSGPEWTAPGGDLASTRYSRLTQINRDTVRKLGAGWVMELPDRQISRASPVVAGGLMFVTTTAGQVLAVDAATGAQKWTYRPDAPFNGNRGMGMGDGMLFAGLSDSTVIALDQKTGALVWKKEREPAVPAQAMSAAPAYASGVVVAVVSGGDNFARGRVMGLDAKTGRQLWNFEAVPSPGQPGSETWPKDSDVWKYGGGAVWMTPSIDPELGLAYVGTGNAVPQFGGELRPGDNLYTDSVVALDLKTGALRWHYQLIRHDIWEHDLSAPMVLYDTVIDGQPRKGVAVSRTDGFLFLLDRLTGKPLLPIEERPVKQLASQHTAATQPFPVGDRIGPECTPADLVPPGFEPGCYFDPITTERPNVFMPHMNTRFAPFSYSAETRFFYGTACVHPKWVRRADNGWVFIFPSRVPGVMQYGLITALDSRTNRIAWQKKVPYAVCAGSGTSVTAGGVLFHQSPDGTFLALDARTGEQVWQFQTGEVGAPSGNGPGGSPIAVYEVGGQQYVALSNNRHLWAFRLGGQVPPRPAPAPPPAIVGWEGRIVAATSIALGSEEVFNIRTANRKEAWTDPYSVTPIRARLAVGSAVTWTNTSRVAHTIVARDGSWTTGPIQPGGTASVTMGRAGAHDYLCKDHPWSLGELTVE